MDEAALVEVSPGFHPSCSCDGKILGFESYPFSHNHGSGNLPQNERKLLLEGPPIFSLNHDSGVEQILRLGRILRSGI